MPKRLYLDGYGSTKPTIIPFVYTPEDWQYINDRITRHHPDQRAELFIAAAMGWNLAINLINKDK